MAAYPRLAKNSAADVPNFLNFMRLLTRISQTCSVHVPHPIGTFRVPNATTDRVPDANNALIVKGRT